MNTNIKAPLSDPLLLVGKGIALVCQAVMALGAVAVVIGLPVVVIFQDRIVTEYAEKVGDPAASFPILALVGVLLVVLAILAGLFVFFGKLRAIIATVGEGDPFVPDNADRLSLMAWIMLGVQILAIPAAAIGYYIARFAEEVDEGSVHMESGLDLSGILIVVLLFILARVFRKGTEMRADLEGMV